MLARIFANFSHGLGAGPIGLENGLENSIIAKLYRALSWIVVGGGDC